MTTTTLQRPGGLAALVCAATYLFGFSLLIALPEGMSFAPPGSDQTEITEFIAANSVFVSIWFLAIYVVNGLALAVLVLALGERFAGSRPGLAKVITTNGVIWATLVIGAGMTANIGVHGVARVFPSDPQAAARLWDTVVVVETGLGGGNEILGGLLALLIGAAILGTRVLPRALAWLSIVIGGAGLLTLLPFLEPIAAPIFGLGYIVWFIWVGIALFASHPSE